MRIEGLRKGGGSRVTAGVATDFLPAERRLRGGRIRLTVYPDDDAVVEYLDSSGERPGIEETEAVSIDAFDEAIGDRIVRAMASMHLGIEEAETSSTAADVSLIEEGFRIGVLDNDVHVWMRLNEGWTEIVTKLDMSGLPSSATDAALAMAFAPNRRRVSFTVDDLAMAFQIINNGTLRQMHNPTQDVEIFGYRTVPLSGRLH